MVTQFSCGFSPAEENLLTVHLFSSPFMSTYKMPSQSVGLQAIAIFRHSCSDLSPRTGTGAITHVTSHHRVTLNLLSSLPLSHRCYVVPAN
ncbi:hypothetical protein MHYP_G00027350 [Metynnis hypsauchen]